MPENRFELTYLPSLDGLRGVAVLLVMAHHAVPSVMQGGFLGVDLFFVLSGFLITELLMQEWNRTGSINLRNFYARRALRLLPALLTLLFVVLVVPSLFGFGFTPWKTALIVLFYSANWVSAFLLVNLGVLSPTWSLAIEEQFYILWPPILKTLLALRLRRHWIISLVLSGIIGASIIRVMLWQSYGPNIAPRLYYGLDTHMDSLLLGCLVGLLASWNLLPREGWLLTAAKHSAAPAAVIVLGLAYRAPTPMSSYLYYGVELVVCVAVAIFIIALLASPPKFISLALELRSLVWVGKISYGLYLWHVPIFHGLMNPWRMARLGVSGLTLQLLRFTVTFAVASASFYLIELRMLRLKKRFQTRSDNVAHYPLEVVWRRT